MPPESTRRLRVPAILRRHQARRQINVTFLHGGWLLGAREADRHQDLLVHRVGRRDERESFRSLLQHQNNENERVSMFKRKCSRSLLFGGYTLEWSPALGGYSFGLTLLVGTCLLTSNGIGNMHLDAVWYYTHGNKIQWHGIKNYIWTQNIKYRWLAAPPTARLKDTVSVSPNGLFRLLDSDSDSDLDYDSKPNEHYALGNAWNEFQIPILTVI